MKIESLTHHGMGRAMDGTLVPRVLAGEEVELVDGVARVLTPSTDRVSAPCRHFKTCGGCLMQHASDDLVAEWKQGIVRTALSGQGLPDDVAGITTSPAQSRRRAKLTGRRTKKGAMVGFHGRGSDMLIAVPDCQLLSPALIAGFTAAEALTRMMCSRSDEIAITLTESLGGLDVFVDHPRELTGQMRIELAQLAQEYGLARLTYGAEPIVTINASLQAFGAAKVSPPAGAFLQATLHGEATLVNAVKEITQGASRVVDLFSGCGTFSLPLAEQSEVLAVEGEAAMTAALDKGWRAAKGLKHVATETRDLFRRPLLPDELRRFDAAVIDPPRAGAEAQIAEIAAAQVPVIAMVSCNPITFARDARRLCEAGYEIAPPLVVDQFRWSPHVEVVAKFTLS